MDWDREEIQGWGEEVQEEGRAIAMMRGCIKRSGEERVNNGGFQEHLSWVERSRLRRMEAEK